MVGEEKRQKNDVGRKVSQGVENAQEEEKNINILLKSNYILYGILWFEKKKTRQ